MMTENKQMIVNIMKFIVENVLASSICFTLFIFFSIVVLAVLPSSLFVYLCILLVPINFIFTRVVLCLCSLEVNEISKYINKYKIFMLLFLLADVLLFFLILKVPFSWPFWTSFIIPMLIVYAIFHKIKASIREKFYKSSISLFVISICIFLSSYILSEISGFYVFNSYMERNILLLSCIVLFISVSTTFIDYTLIKWLNLYFKLPNLNKEHKKYKTIFGYLVKTSIYFYTTFAIYFYANTTV